MQLLYYISQPSDRLHYKYYEILIITHYKYAEIWTILNKYYIYKGIGAERGETWNWNNTPLPSNLKRVSPRATNCEADTKRSPRLSRYR